MELYNNVYAEVLDTLIKFGRLSIDDCIDICAEQKAPISIIKDVIGDLKRDMKLSYRNNVYEF